MKNISPSPFYISLTLTPSPMERGSVLTKPSVLADFQMPDILSKILPTKKIKKFAGVKNEEHQRDKD